LSSMNMLNIGIDPPIFANCLSHSHGFTKPLQSSRPLSMSPLQSSDQNPTKLAILSHSLAHNRDRHA
jgi:hypothetical protein